MTELDNLVDHQRIIAIDVAAIPAPPNSAYPGEHLFVNCHYHVDQSDRLPHELLDLARADALIIMNRLTALSDIQLYPWALITVYGHFPVAGAERPARRRIYRVSIRGKDIPTNGALLTPDFFGKVGAAESSELDDVAELLTESAT